MVLVAGILILFQSCKSYRQNLMFQQEGNPPYMEANANNVLTNYTLQPNDKLELKVYTQKGERIIDPEFELAENNRDGNNARPELVYEVREDGMITLPMVGSLYLAGLKVYEAEKLLEERYAAYYTEPYVRLKYTNKRVVVLGASEGQVIPIENENTRVSEILALAQAVDNDASATNMRLIRDKEVFLIDFSTVEAFMQSNYIVKSGDIIYVEPIRRPFNEFLRDNGPAISIVASVLSLVVVIISLNQ